MLRVADGVGRVGVGLGETACWTGNEVARVNEGVLGTIKEGLSDDGDVEDECTSRSYEVSTN